MNFVEPKRIVVSIIIPIRNEEMYLKKCIESLLEQDYSKKLMEIIFVDGNSTDSTLTIVNSYVKRWPNLIYLLHNPQKTVPYAMNIGIKHSIGKYIIRMDAHSHYFKNYVSKCVEWLEKTGADNVGGVAITQSHGLMGKSIALMLSSKFGVGNSKFRINGSDGYVDTVPFGAFKRDVFKHYGYYDERLDRNQDNEMNYRIRKGGGKLYLSHEIKFVYYCRDTLSGICKMALQNGCWNVITYTLCPGSMSIRHFVPFLFVISLILMFITFVIFPISFLKYLWILELVIYFVLDISSSYQLTVTTQFRYFLLLFFLFPVFHVSYGVGSIWGILKLKNKKRINNGHI